ncbi:(4Fe-4S)-binding protein [Mesorhizobium sp. UC22_110]|uniref:(4Fe-4S)-binding protein n=1 Tax=Mesorhizobium sp. UC22_110 TaxID=3374552 RepID=UPI0037565622
MARKFVESENIDVGFDGKLCIHSRNCVLGHPEVFVPNAPGQWIHPEAGAVEAIVGVAHSCPSGAITYRRKDGGREEAAPVVNLVRVRENGPLAFNAEMDINGEVMLRATLCRCGASENKPFCDGSHTKAGFAATGEPETGSSSRWRHAMAWSRSLQHPTARSRSKAISKSSPAPAARSTA